MFKRIMELSTERDEQAAQIEMLRGVISNAIVMVGHPDNIDYLQSALSTPPVQALEAGKRDSVPEWFPIETAPKVGAHLACELPNKNDRRPYVIVWLDADHPDAEGAGWYEHWNFDPVEPTHWRPLPATPKGEKE